MKISFHRTLVLLGLIIWISETVYFGFNDTPQSGWEKILDFVSFLMIIWGVIGDVLSGISVNKYYARENEYNIENAKITFTEGSSANFGYKGRSEI